MDRDRSRLVTVVLVLASIGVGAWAWRVFARDRVVPKRLGTVIEGQVYRSGQLHPALIEHTLDTLGIRTIVALNADQPPTEAEIAEAAAATRLGVDREVFPLEGDGRGNIESYAQAIAAIDRATRDGGPVLVHCSAGTYRTGGVVAAFRMLVQGWSPEDARREMIRFNWNEEDPLLPAYLDENMPRLAQRLVELGVIDRVPQPLPSLEAGAPASP